MYFLRRLSLGCFVVAGVAIVLDVVVSLFAAGDRTLVSIGLAWQQLAPSSLGSVQQQFGHHVSSHLLRGLLDTPVGAALTLIGLLLFGASRGVRGVALEHETEPQDDPTVASRSSSPRESPPARAPSKDQPRPNTLRAPRSEIASALMACRTAFIGIGLFSGMINILMLTGSMFMLEVYDRVLPSRSVPTLVGLMILAAILFMGMAFLDLIRSRLLVRVGASIDEALSGRVYDAIVRLPLKTGSPSDGLQPLRDLDNIRHFFSGLGPTALFDLPWMPLYLAIIFAFHPVLGLVAGGGALVLVALTVLADLLTQAPTRSATISAMARNAEAESGRRNAEVLAAMGLAERMQLRWQQGNQGYVEGMQRASDVSGGIGALTRALRMLLQSGVLAVGAFLVIHQEATAGIIIAGSILVARALAPVDLAVANWRGFVAARQSYHRLGRLLALLPAQREPMALPPPQNTYAVENVSLAPPGIQRLVVQDVSFRLKRGQRLGIIGASGSGKSSLARALVGVWQPARGKVRLDGATLDQWAPEQLGSYIGYLPQDIELFSGTIAQNICRFDPEVDPDAIVGAAKAADVHGLILSLPKGYDTEIGDHGAALSAGQRQRVALARAMYGNPFLVVLDEPNSNLDAGGEAALTQAIGALSAKGAIVVVISHRPSIMAAMDLALVMNQGRAQAFGPKDEVLSKVLRSAAAPPLKVVPQQSRTPS